MNAAPILKRGSYVLPHQCQQVRRDLDGEQISRHLGGEAHAVRVTAEHLQDCRDGKPGTGIPYEYLIRSPQSSALAWTAFRNRADLALFLDAYALTIDREPAPGESFRVHLPADARDWRALTGLELAPTLYVTSAGSFENHQLRTLTRFGIGDRVTVLGGIEAGMVGIIVANEPDRTRDNPYHVDRPYRFRVRFVPCSYCGDGLCSGSARTANGGDVERWHAVHTSGRPMPGTIGGFAPVDLDHARE